ncbi:GNAT family N-acetyltransferase [Legionella shakespearei]|nr:GNAT family N-acetyltransferase [Legionella shakespearei]
MKKEYSDISFENLKSYWQTLANANGICRDDKEALALFLGATNPLFNPMFLEKQASISTLTACRHRHTLWWDNQRNRQLSVPQSQWSVLMDGVPMMVKEIKDELPVELPQGIMIKIIENNSDLSQWMEPLAICFGVDEVTAQAYQRALEANPDKLVHVVALDKGKCIGTGSIFLSAESAGLYNLSVLPEYRRQGIGKALHHFRFNHIKSLGYQYATLQATPMAKHLDETLGFETCSLVTIYGPAQ